jgi:integrase
MVYNSFFDEEIWKNVNQNNKELLNDFLLELKQMQRSDGTIYAYKKDIMGFLCDVYRMFKNCYVLELSKKDIRKYSIYLQKSCGVSNSRHNRIKSAIGSMMAFAEEEEDYDYDTNVVRKVHGLPKNPVREIVFLSDDQIQKILNSLIEQESYQDATMLSLAYESIARKGELLQVKKYSFFDCKKNNSNRVIGKGGKEFSLLYFDKTKQCANLWLEQRGEDNIDSLWVVGSGKSKHAASSKNIYDAFIRMRDILSSFDDEEYLEFNVHSMRHSGIQNLSDGTHWLCKEKNNGEPYDLNKIQILANHSNISTTSDYLKDNSIQELEDLFNITIDES